jgi:deoxyribodipyrimidine photo-lyase
MNTVFWFRRDLRLGDNEALTLAATEANGAKLAACYLVDLSKFERLEGIRQHSLVESLRSLNDDMGLSLAVIQRTNLDEAASRLGEIALSLGAKTVIASRAFDPEGVAEQNRVGLALKEHGVFLKLVGSNYAVTPGSVSKPDGTPYRVYTPFYKAWVQLLELKTFDSAESVLKRTDFAVTNESGQLPSATKPSPIRVRAGEQFALRTFDRFKRRALNSYDELRNRADISGTSHLSHALAHGEIHPRTLLAELDDTPGHEVFRKEIAWREFYADVLWHNPHTADDYFEPRFAGMRYDSGPEAERRFDAWKAGRTGYPMVDAGMRQLAETGWMHNRLRMIVASFLVKDLHLEWQRGAAWFEANLSDFDPASNSHGWQWTAGCGTDASPYYRVFNPVMQGLKFDPNGDYVRKFIPELGHIKGAAVHEPWNLLDGYAGGYAEPIVDHAREREESLVRLEELKQR